MRSLSGLRAIASEYDVFFVDLWGVIHDGERPFEGAVDALRRLSVAGRRVVFITNSSRAGAAVVASLDGMGVGAELYEAVISSGDVTRDALARRDPALFGPLPDGPRCFHWGDSSFVPWLFELGLRWVDDVAHADLVVATGSVRDDATLTRVRELLAPAAARRAPLVCTNPDRVIPSVAGSTMGPGAVADAYAELGGPTFLYGKPHPPIYAAARRLLGAASAARAVAIGDLLDTDVRGARGAQIASALVTSTGGYAQALGPTPSALALDALFAAAGVAPDMLLARFAW